MDKYGIPILRLFLFLILISSLLFSSNSNAEKKIYTNIVHVLFPNKTNVKVWTDMNNKRDILDSIKYINLVNNMSQADLLIIKNTKNIKNNTLKFATSYNMLKHYKKDIVGGFYWQKGRPNILFIKDNIEKYNIKLPPSMKEYIESEF